MIKNNEMTILYPTGIKEFDEVSILKCDGYTNSEGEVYVGHGISSGSILLLALHEDVKSDDSTLDNIIENITSGFDKCEVHKYDAIDNKHAELFYHNMECNLLDIHGAKSRNIESYKYFTGYYDNKGDKVYDIQPTFIVINNPPIIDSSDGIRAVSEFFTTAIAYLKGMNIILIITTNLINPFLEFNPNNPTIKQSVTISHTPIYFSDTLFEVYDDKYRVIKSRYSHSGQIIERDNKESL